MQNYKDFKKENENMTSYGENFGAIISNFLFFLKSYFINPLAVSRTMKSKENLKFSLFTGSIHIITSMLLFLGFCLNCTSVLKRMYSGVVSAPIGTSLLLGLLFAILTCLCFFVMTFIVSHTKDAQKAKFLETISVFCSNTIGLSFLYVVCFVVSFISFYLSILVFLLSLFYFSVICTIGIEALTDAMIFGKQAFTTSCVVSAMLSCLVFVFVIFLYVIFSSFVVDGEYLKDVFYIVFRYLK